MYSSRRTLLTEGFPHSGMIKIGQHIIGNVPEFCNLAMFTPCILDRDTKELVDLHDFAKEKMGDVAYHPETGEKYYPIRVQILKTLLVQMSFCKQIHVYIENSNRDAILILRAALRRDFEHDIVEKTFERETKCRCAAQTAVTTGMYCQICRCVICEHCSHNDCAGKMNKLVNFFITGVSDHDSDNEETDSEDSEGHTDTSTSDSEEAMEEGDEVVESEEGEEETQEMEDEEEEDEMEETEVQIYEEVEAEDIEEDEEVEEYEEMEEEEESEIDSDAEIDVVNVSFVEEDHNKME